MIKRYDHTGGASVEVMYEDDDGDWVRWKDIDAALAGARIWLVDANKAVRGVEIALAPLFALRRRSSASTSGVSDD